MGWAGADVPHKVPVTRYTGLWTNSPFTSKPPPDAMTGPANPLSDYALGGISPIKGGYRVTLLNRKKPEERIVVESDDPSSAFKILTVNRKPGDPLGTTVRLSSGANVGVVAFDEKLLTLKEAAPQNPNSAQQNPRQGVPAQQQPAPDGQPNPQGRVPRPRTIPPPEEQTTNGRQPATGRQNINGRTQRQTLR